MLATQKMWGSFGTASRNGDYLFLFDTSTVNGLELARIPWDKVEDITQVRRRPYI